MKLTKPQRAALKREAFKPGEVHPRTLDWLLAHGLVERDGVGGMVVSANMQGRGSHQNPLTYVRTKAGEAANRAKEASVKQVDLDSLRDVADAVFCSGAHSHAGIIEQAIAELNARRAEPPAETVKEARGLARTLRRRAAVSMTGPRSYTDTMAIADARAASLLEGLVNAAAGEAG